MPYVCKFCRGRYCAAHRLPENHDCQGLGPYRERMRAEGRFMAPEPDVVRPEVSAAARAGMSMERFWTRVDGRMTQVILATILVVFALEWLVLFTAPSLFDDLFVIEADYLVQPWTILVSIFAHDPTSLNHILFNGLVLYFFGSSTERLIGTRRFTWLFLAAGIVGGIAQIVLTQMIFRVDTAGLGASGAIQGIMGTLVVLAPRLTVLVFFVIPAPLWAITVVYVLLDLAGLVTPGDRIGHFAHLAGLATGLLFGYWLRQQGLRAVVNRPPPTIRRYI